MARCRRVMCWVVVAVLFAVAGDVYGQAVDAASVIGQQEARLGAVAGTIDLNQPARLSADVTIAEGHGLLIRAPLTVSKGSIHLMGHNEVRCVAPIRVEDPTELFVANGASDISVRGCDVTVAGNGGGYLLVATKTARVIETDNHLIGMAAFTTQNVGGPASETSDVTITNNSVEFARGGGAIGVYLMYVLRGVVANNRFTGTAHGVEWWGGDANAGWRSAAEVTGAGELSITGNQCSSAGGSCVWGSMGFDVTVSGNVAEICSDVCFDTEGGVRNLFTGNVARACSNGCYAAEFESQDAVFEGNLAYADAKSPSLALVLIKHPSGRGPNHVNLTVTGNTLVCGGKVCSAFYSEGEDGLVFANNVITNGFISFVNYTNTVLIRGNVFRFTVPVTGVTAIGGPTLYNRHRSEIAENTVVNESGANANSTCIAQSWSDYNNVDEMSIVRNRCSGFARGILTETAGKNPGAPHAVWFVEGNQFMDVPESAQIVHVRSSGNEMYTVNPALAAPK